jgi:hypothetical protein
MKEYAPIKIGSKIPKDPDDIQEYTKEVLAILSRHVTITEQLGRKIKLILTELVTNSIKHSKDPEALIRLTINHPQLTIEKVDIGLQIKFKSAEQIPFEEANRTIKVDFTEASSLHIKIVDPYRFIFIDAFKENMSIEQMPEHFGLYIITMASDSFEYHHDPESQENTFVVNIKL